MSTSHLFTELEAAVSIAETSIVVRSAGAIAEVKGPLSLRLGKEWLTIGEEGGSYVHLRQADLGALRFVHPSDANASLEVLDVAGEILVRIHFRGTNPAKPERFDARRAADVTNRFAAHAAGPA